MVFRRLVGLVLPYPLWDKRQKVWNRTCSRITGEDPPEAGAQGPLLRQAAIPTTGRVRQLQRMTPTEVQVPTKEVVDLIHRVPGSKIILS